MKPFHPLIIASLLAAAPASAIITYRDENGTLHAVQTEEEIPEQYRPSTKRLAGKNKNTTVGVAPMTKVGTINVVDVQIGDKTYRFAVDKEEYTSQISKDIAASLNLRKVDQATVPTYKGPARVPMVIVPAVTVAGRKHSNFKVAVVPQDPKVGTDGKLGKTFLERWDVKIDEANGRLLVEPKKTFRASMKSEDEPDAEEKLTPSPKNDKKAGKSRP